MKIKVMHGVKMDCFLTVSDQNHKGNSAGCALFWVCSGFKYYDM